MDRLENYRLALLVSDSDTARDDLLRVLDSRASRFVQFVTDHGLGPVWHERTGSDAFVDARRAAEALFVAQDAALVDINRALDSSGIEFAVIKGGANRYLLYENPALRACYDLDLLVRPTDRVRAALALAGVGFEAAPDADSISREIVLARGRVDVDLHWSLLREGRLRDDNVAAMLARRRQFAGQWMLHPDDALFLSLVHAAFAQHLSGWNMGLHRVADIDCWLRTQPVDWPAISEQLRANGVQTAAWAALRWVQLLMPHGTPGDLDSGLRDKCPGAMRRSWIEHWLQEDLPARLDRRRWLRLLGFTSLLHDTPRDAVRALAGRYRAWRRRGQDLAVFKELSG